MTEDAAYWRGYLTADVDNDDRSVGAEVVVYCPACAAREFGPAGTIRS